MYFCHCLGTVVALLCICTSIGLNILPSPDALFLLWTTVSVKYTTDYTAIGISHLSKGLAACRLYHLDESHSINYRSCWYRWCGESWPHIYSKEMMQIFISKRLNTNALLFWELIQRLNIKMFSTITKKVKMKASDDKVLIMTGEQYLLQNYWWLRSRGKLT